MSILARALLAILLGAACSRHVDVKRQVDVHQDSQADVQKEQHTAAAVEQRHAQDAGSTTHTERTEQRDPETTNIVERWDRPVAVELPDGGVIIAAEHHEKATSKATGAFKEQVKQDVEQHSAESGAAKAAAKVDAKEVEQAKTSLTGAAREQTKTKTIFGYPPWMIGLALSLVLLLALGALILYVRRVVPRAQK